MLTKLTCITKPLILQKIDKNAYYSDKGFQINPGPISNIVQDASTLYIQTAFKN